MGFGQQLRTQGVAPDWVDDAPAWPVDMDIDTAASKATNAIRKCRGWLFIKTFRVL